MASGVIVVTTKKKEIEMSQFRKSLMTGTHKGQGSSERVQIPQGLSKSYTSKEKKTIKKRGLWHSSRVLILKGEKKELFAKKGSEWQTKANQKRGGVLFNVV